MNFKEYREKRDFQQTPEPSGEITDIEQSRFVIQRHQASHLHFDFRLEMDGVLKSWAVPKGPPITPGEKRLAVQVEDHPLDYIKFAGIIPEGQYGAGTVEIWDKGEYTLNKKYPTQIEFGLKGKKMAGTFVLIQTKGNNWLFIKRADKL
jgi:bifunctional non-homologous end joining protein LigD